MIRRLFFALGALAVAAMAAGSLRAEEPSAEEPAAAVENPPAARAAEPSGQGPSLALNEEAAPPGLREGGNPVADKAPPSEQASEEAAASPKAEGPQIPERPAAAESRSEDKPDPAKQAVSPPKPLPALSAEAEALRKALSGLPAGTGDEERNERAALLAFYEARSFEPLWTAPQTGFTQKAAAAAAEIRRAGEWGLDAKDFALPAGIGVESAKPQSPDALAAAEVKISLAILKYGRHARGGRIIAPSEQLSSYLDRRPQLLKPQAILEGAASADEPGAYLRSLHPKHPQFEKLRQKYLALGKQRGAEGKRLLVNMEQWRWMPDDLGEVYVWNNIPEFTQRVIKDGAVVRKEAIVTGQIGKQTPIFSRPLRKITFKPTWIVPDSIKVRELLPNMMRGGGSLMSQWGLEVWKDGARVNWRKINWASTDIRTYDVIQPNGAQSVLGKVKFSFPSQHTVFMHDAAEGEKWMFRAPKRTYSHGCMRVQNPVGLAEILLREDKGWDAAKTREVLSKGGNNNEIPIERKIMVHMAYFTALVDDDGKLRTVPDVYGHEQRITLALEGKWRQIDKGRDHLAPVELHEAGPGAVRRRRYADDDPAPDARAWRRRSEYSDNGNFLDSLFGGYRPSPVHVPPRYR